MADPHHASDSYDRGSQEISEQESTFSAFMGMSKWGSLIIAVLLVFLDARSALWVAVGVPVTLLGVITLLPMTMAKMPKR